MKKLLFCSFLSLSLGLSGQTMDQGDSFINVGGGLDSALIVTYEYGLFSNITIGPFLGIYKDKIKTTTSFEPTTSDENTTGKAKTTTTFQTTTSEVNTKELTPPSEVWSITTFSPTAPLMFMRVQF